MSAPLRQRIEKAPVTLANIVSWRKVARLVINARSAGKNGEIFMHIGILRTDSVRQSGATHGEYPDMFERLLLAENDTLRFTT